MAFTAQHVIDTVQPILQDATAVRWPVSELIDHINESLRVIANEKPNALSKTVTIDMAAGTKQTVPAGYHRVLRVVANANGFPIFTADERMFDAYFPGWRVADTLPSTKTVAYFMEDTMDTSTFYVCPPNDGTGQIDVILGEVPTSIDAAGDTVPIGDIYRQAVCDFTIYRAFSKDMNAPGLAQRATFHYQMFQQALGIRSQIEVAQTPESPTTRFSR